MNVILIGSAGRMFHNFNVYFRNQTDMKVVAFFSNQLPDILDKRYPASLAGKNYPDGIPIYEQHRLEEILEANEISNCYFCYTDISNEDVMHYSALFNAKGINFVMLGPGQTQLKAPLPVIAVSAARTGCGKSQTVRRVIEEVNRAGKRAVIIRHPMPYGNLSEKAVQRFATVDDLARHKCIIKEYEEYEPLIAQGITIYSGLDYEKIIRDLQQESSPGDLIIWDGGNNDAPFLKTDLLIHVVDPHRPGQETTYYPGAMSLKQADVIIINKIDSASPENIDLVRQNIAHSNPTATVIDAASPISVEAPDIIRGQRVLVVEDGSSITKGGIKTGAGIVAALKFGAREIIDPRPFTVGRLSELFEAYPEINNMVPAIGHGIQEMKDLKATIDNADCDTVVIGTPMDLSKVITISKPSTRVHYELQELGEPSLAEIIRNFIKKHNL